ncbi:MAG: 3-isopropylmalate dehydratase small subunit [Candidatus Sumerlaeaceae bacterium]
MDDLKRVKITGTAIPVRGNDIDTDRIIPARYLKCVVFDGLGEHAFEDDRLQLKERGQTHSYDNPAFADAEILLVNKNFGCGSSREHAPQAIMRWGKGIKAIVGESFAEIFFGNCVALGIPCAVVDEAGANKLQSAAEASPDAQFTVDVDKQVVTVGNETVPFEIPAGVRQQFLEGKWDSTAELLAAQAQIAVTAGNLPYFNGWQ